MAATFVTEPLYPLAPTTAAPVVVTVTLTGGGNYYRAYCTDAPIGSGLKKRIDANNGARVEVGQSTRSTTLTLDAEKLKLTPADFDKAGAYVLTVDEVTLGASTTGGGYEGDPAGLPEEVIVSSTANLKIYIGQRLETKVGVGSDSATLVLFVWNDTIRETLVDTHGVRSPDLTLPTSAKAASACDDATVRTKLAALKNVVATTALGDLSAAVDNFVTKYNSHRTQATVHNSNDANNALNDVPAGTKSASAFIASVSAIRKRLAFHMANDNNGTGTDSARYHEDAGSLTTIDYKNALVASPPGDMASARACFADAHRAYEAHRVQIATPASHDNADTANVLTALSPLLQLDSAFMSALQPISPTVPATGQSGVVALVSGGGFTAV